MNIEATDLIEAYLLVGVFIDDVDQVDRLVSESILENGYADKCHDKDDAYAL